MKTESQMPDKAAYLGDGAYVRFEGFAFVIFTSDGIDEANHIWLEPGHIAALNEFVQQVRQSND